MEIICKTHVWYSRDTEFENPKSGTMSDGKVDMSLGEYLNHSNTDHFLWAKIDDIIKLGGRGRGGRGRGAGRGMRGRGRGRVCSHIVLSTKCDM